MFYFGYQSSEIDLLSTYVFIIVDSAPLSNDDKAIALERCKNIYTHTHLFIYIIPCC